VATALVQALLHRLTGQTDLALGTLVAGRDRPETQDTIGFLVNTLVLRQTVDPEAGFRALLSTTRATCLDAIVDQYCPFEALVGAVGAPRDMGRNPLFDVMVVWQLDEAEPPDLHGLTTRKARYDFPFAKFDLGFYFSRRGDRIVCQIEYAEDLFDTETAGALLARLDTLAAAVVADPGQPVGTLPVLPDAERALVVEAFNATGTPLDTRRTIIRPLLDRVAASPSAPAVLWSARRPLDYRRFAARAGAVARRLAAGRSPSRADGRGLRAEIARSAHRHPRHPDGWRGLCPARRGRPAARLAGMLEDLDHPLVLAAPECRAKVESGAARVLDLHEAGQAEPLDLGAPDGLAYVLFTSGSSGRPKGVRWNSIRS